MGVSLSVKEFIVDIITSKFEQNWTSTIRDNCRFIESWILIGFFIEICEMFWVCWLDFSSCLLQEGQVIVGGGQRFYQKNCNVYSGLSWTLKHATPFGLPSEGYFCGGVELRLSTESSIVVPVLTPSLLQCLRLEAWAIRLWSSPCAKTRPSHRISQERDRSRRRPNDPQPCRCLLHS